MQTPQRRAPRAAARGPRFAGALVALWLAAAGFTPTAMAFELVNRWGGTSQGATGFLGSPAVISWGFAAEGAPVSASVTGPNGLVTVSGPSGLVAFFDATLGVPADAGLTDLTQKSWFPLIESTFARWDELSGVTYLYEPNDDGVLVSGSNSTAFRGLTGVRADVRLSGQSIDGGTGLNILALNYFPHAGDMIIDTDNGAFFGNAAGGYIRLRNTMTHELGHGLGLGHPSSSDLRILMEGLIDPTIDGPQIDDILGIQRLYGDPYEEGAGNDAPLTATPLGALTLFSNRAIGTSARDTVVAPTANDFVSLDALADIDVYRFQAGAAGLTDVRLRPLGPTYQVGPENGVQFPFEAARQSDLTLEVFDASNTLVAQASFGALGDPEVLVDLALTPGAGYYARVSGSQDSPQLYELEVALNPARPTGGVLHVTGAGAHGQTSATVSNGEVAVALSAVGQGATLAEDAFGLGVLSTTDTGAPAEHTRIDGASEAIEFSFDRDVFLQALELNNLSTDGAESAYLGFVSGDNPFVGLTGYAGAYAADSLGIEFLSPQWQSDQVLMALGVAGQSPLLVRAGTVLSLASRSATAGGLVLTSIFATPTPEPGAAALALLALAPAARRRRA